MTILDQNKRAEETREKLQEQITLLDLNTSDIVTKR